MFRKWDLSFSLSLKKKKDRTLLPPSHTNVIADIGLRYRHNKSQAPYRARLSTAREVLPYTNHKPRLKKAQLAKTNIPFNSYPIFYTNKCFILKQEDFKAPKAYVAANQCSSLRAKRFLRKNPQGSRFENSFSLCFLIPCLSAPLQTCYPLLCQSLFWDKEGARGLWGLCWVFAYKVPPWHSGIWLEPTPACSRSQGLLMHSVIAFGKNQVVNQRRGKKFQESKSRMFSITHVC